MAISSVSPNVNVQQPQAQPTPDKTDAGKSSSEAPAQAAPAQAAPAPTVLTQGTSAAHHHKKKVHHPLPGQPGNQVNKTA
jgi:hypothetical protein